MIKSSSSTADLTLGSSGNLAASCRQSRKELWFMLGTWAFFCIWVLVATGISAYDAEASGENLLLGFPRWVVFGLLLPWFCAIVVTLWFASRFMKDTPLHDGAGEKAEPGTFPSG